jgi:methylmalonyl-CoA/ethylmalonyl-CoA epimerase
MQFDTVDHIGIFTDDADEGIAFFESIGGETVYDERVEEHNTRVVFVESAGTYYEFLEPYGQGMVMDAFEKYGPGFEHVAYRVDDIDAAVEAMRADGVAFQSDEPRPGAGNSRIIYLETDHAAGLEVELVELLEGDVRLE